MDQVKDIDTAIEFIIQNTDSDNNIQREALRISLYEKLDYRIGNFLQLDDAGPLSLTNKQLGALVRELLHAMEDVGCEGFTAHEIATLNKMLREFMMFYNATMRDSDSEFKIRILGAEK